MSIDRIAIHCIEDRLTLSSSPQQPKRERGDYGMEKRYRSRRIRKPATNLDEWESVPDGRSVLQRDNSALPKLRRRPPMPRHQLHRHPRQARHRRTRSNRPAPPNLSSTMPNLRMHHYLRRVRAITSIDRLQPAYLMVQHMPPYARSAPMGNT